MVPNGSTDEMSCHIVIMIDLCCEAEQNVKEQRQLKKLKDKMNTHMFQMHAHMHTQLTDNGWAPLSIPT